MGDCRCSHPSREVALHGCKQNIRKYGWHCTGVYGDHALSPFSYTVGLRATFDHRELAVFGLPPHTACGLLHAAVQKIKAGTVLAEGSEHDGIAAGYRVRFRGPLTRPSQPCTMARAYYGFMPDYLELVWPDARGRFPGEEGCDPVVAQLQAANA